MTLPDVSVIGTGALGSTLAKALHIAGFPVKSLFSRSEHRANDLLAELNGEIAGAFPKHLNVLGRATFITVPDSGISAVARRLSNLEGDFSNLFFVHCSGNETSAILRSLREKSASCASFHPLQTFNAESAASDFKGIYFNAEGDAPVIELLFQVAGELDAHCFEISPEAKPFLHAAAVMSSNYLMALLDASGKISEMGGINEQQVRKALLPLIRKTLDNTGEGKLADVLSGPIARGDISTVRKHLQLLEHKPGLLALYKQLGLATLDIASRKESSEGSGISKLRQLLS